MLRVVQVLVGCCGLSLSLEYTRVVLHEGGSNLFMVVVAFVGDIDVVDAELEENAGLEPKFGIVVELFGHVSDQGIYIENGVLEFVEMGKLSR